ncbi:MAG: hypothetical protein R3F19_31485 [Verrucomicrobiales bacterium]
MAARLGVLSFVVVAFTGFAPAEELLKDDFDDDELDEALWTVNLDIPQGGSSVTEIDGYIELIARGYLITSEEFDPVALGGIRITGQWTFVSGDDFLQIVIRSDGQPAGDYGETANGIEFNVSLTDAANDLEIKTRDAASIQVQEQGSRGVIDASPGLTFNFEIIDNGEGGLSFTMTDVDDPENSATTTATIIADNFDQKYIAFHNREAGGRTAYLDNVLIETIEDSDGDGLPDIWEEANDLDPDDNGENPNNKGVAGDPAQGADGDPDEDMSTNLAEFTRGTDPQDSDSDDDSLLDGVETGTGTWVSTSDTGTNPLTADSDGDTLPDNIENPDLAYDSTKPLEQPGTDPNLADSDGDDFRDNVELVEGTNPTDPNSFTVIDGKLPLADDFENNLLNPAKWTINTDIPQAGASVTAVDGQVELVGRGYLITTQQYDPEVVGGIRITGQWTFVSGDDFLQILTRTDALPAGDYGETANGIEFNVALTDATKDLEIKTRDAASIVVTEEGERGIIEAAAGMTFDFEIIDDGNGGLSFTMTEVDNPDNTATTIATVDVDDFNLNYIAFHNREAGRRSIVDNLSITSLAGAAIRATGIAYDQATNMVTLTWTSTESKSYSVYATQDFSLNTEVDDGVVADPGSTTTFTFESPLPAPPATTHVFFGVRENP